MEGGTSLPRTSRQPRALAWESLGSSAWAARWGHRVVPWWLNQRLGGLAAHLRAPEPARERFLRAQPGHKAHVAPRGIKR